MWRWSEPLLNCVSRKMRRRSELMQLLIGMSTRRYFPASGTAGLARSLVSGKSRVPAPPPMITATMWSGRSVEVQDMEHLGDENQVSDGGRAYRRIAPDAPTVLTARTPLRLSAFILFPPTPPRSSHNAATRARPRCGIGGTPAASVAVRSGDKSAPAGRSASGRRSTGNAGLKRPPGPEASRRAAPRRATHDRGIPGRAIRRAIPDRIASPGTDRLRSGRQIGRSAPWRRAEEGRDRGLEG